jgi:hypothetical protein
MLIENKINYSLIFLLFFHKLFEVLFEYRSTGTPNPLIAQDIFRGHLLFHSEYTSVFSPFACACEV